jgi:hypothetical protein
MFSQKNVRDFWQAVSDNLHIRPFYVAKSQTKIVSPIRNPAKINRVWWQGITAKPTKNYDKAQADEQLKKNKAAQKRTAER